MSPELGERCRTGLLPLFRKTNLSIPRWANDLGSMARTGELTRQAAGELVEFILSSGRAREFHLQV
jgi:hypothetical protein